MRSQVETEHIKAIERAHGGGQAYVEDRIDSGTKTERQAAPLIWPCAWLSCSDKFATDDAAWAHQQAHDARLNYEPQRRDYFPRSRSRYSDAEVVETFIDSDSGRPIFREDSF